MMRRHKSKDEPTMKVRRREDSRDVPSRASPAAPDDEAMARRRHIDTTPESVRGMHAAMYRRLRRHMELNRSVLTDDAWRLLTRVAFALYVDSQEPDEAFLPLPAVAEPAA